MSRLGKLPIELAQETQVKIDGDFIVVKGEKGELKQQLHPFINIEIGEKEVKVSIDDAEDRKKRSLWGLYRSLIRNMVQGVEKGFEKKLEVNGVGYRVAVSGKKS